MKRVLIGALIFIVYLACIIAAGFALHFAGARFILFCVVLGLLGGATVAFAIWYLSRMGGEAAQAGGSDAINLDALLHDADHKLRSSRLAIKSLAQAQIIYVVGEDNAAKTQTVLQSGLDVELLAGNVFRDGSVAPTQLANVWLAGSSVIVEAGGSLLQQPGLWQRLIRATRPGKLGALFARPATQPPRAVVVCVSAERVPGPTEAGYDANKIRASAQMLNARLRQLSQTLGISVPVYVLITKLDTVKHFEHYLSRLSVDEVKSPLGSLVAQVESGSGLYAERASALIGTGLDELIYTLSEFRIEVLSRGGDLEALASAYEFPREMQKKRGTIIDFMVELTRPSQLGINPFLRGFFFSGMRAVMVENVTEAPVQAPANPPVDEGATKVFTFGGAQVNLPRQSPVRSSPRKIPQWAFLPNLFSQLLLRDKSALDISRASNGLNLLKRALMACACSCLVLYIVLLTTSFFNNRGLEELLATYSAVPVYPPAATQFASAHDLQALDQLGALVRKLDFYRKAGPPLMYSWGLYSGDALYPVACSVYGNRFRALLLGPAQSNILKRVRTLQYPPRADEDYSATYRPLKAYLISTSNPEKDAEEPGFLAPALTSAWAGTVTVPSDLASLAQTQFQTYATLLAEPKSCMASVGGQPDDSTVGQGRRYLRGFGGFQHIYQSMRAGAAKASSSVRFNDEFHGSSTYIRDSYEVPGEFTRKGFAFMQDAIQHPDPYFSGETWVLGPAAGPMQDRGTLMSDLQKQYVTDYLTQWRKYMNAARFVGFGDWNDAATKLSALDSNASAILQLFSLVSINTGVGQPEIVAAFQGPQSVVPSGNPESHPDSPSNKPYTEALQGVEQAVRKVSENPLSANDPAAATLVIDAAVEAHKATENLRDSFRANRRNSFHPDIEDEMDRLSFARLEDPITSAGDLAKSAPAAAANKAGKDLCAQADSVLSKFPFNPKSSTDASPEEVAKIFATGQGLAQLYSKINQLVGPQGSRYGAISGSTVAINPRFLSFFNAAEQISSALFPAGANQPSLSFTLSEAGRVAATPDAVLNIDGQQVGPGQTVQVHWVSQPSGRITLSTPENVPLATGPWDLFHLAFSAKIQGPNLDVSLQAGGQTYRVVHFGVDGTGVLLLDPAFMNQLRCVSTVTK